MALLVLDCAPLLFAYHYVPIDSPVFYAGMCTDFFLPLALHGPANTVMSTTPQHMRSTFTGFSIRCITMFAISGGNLLVGIVIDYLTATGNCAPITYARRAVDLFVVASALFFALSARAACKRPAIELRPAQPAR